MQSLFITFEGIEGCGKSTQAGRLGNHLKRLEMPSILTREPGGTEVGNDIRQILLDAGNHNLSPLAELLLYEADRAQHVEEVIRPALEQGKWVVCDRFCDATTVYQGYARGLDMDLIHTLNETACSGICPDITFLLDCPVEVGLERALKRDRSSPEKGQDRFEREQLDFHEAVREGYLTMAMEESERVVVVDSSYGEDQLEELIFDHIRPLLPQEGI